MTRKAVYCSVPRCGARYHQEVDPALPIAVAPCIRCRSPGIMIVSPARRAFGDIVDHTSADYETVLTNMALAGSAGANGLLCALFARQRYTLVGFHGCGFSSARSMMRDGIDPAKNTTGARGTNGFYIGSLYTGIASKWSAVAEGRGQGVRTMLAVYVRHFEQLRYEQHYDWGKMDEEDDIAVSGLEMVIFGLAASRIRVVPAGPTATPGLWDACPRDSLRMRERREFAAFAPQLAQASTHLKISVGEIMKKILTQTLSREEEEVLAKLGIA